MTLRRWWRIDVLSVVFLVGIVLWVICWDFSMLLDSWGWRIGLVLWWSSGWWRRVVLLLRSCGHVGSCRGVVLSHFRGHARRWCLWGRWPICCVLVWPWSRGRRSFTRWRWWEVWLLSAHCCLLSCRYFDDPASKKKSCSFIPRKKLRRGKLGTYLDTWTPLGTRRMTSRIEAVIGKAFSA